ncbi:hypothetical protein ZIOFF_040584 [Zingiber officinale]|uniref:Uncharacterized protein n=1 Tax=Zingiber officinale TaxID=94328 RepID=A0A8J5GCU3_ZINOF|nr:hypothetical protein ZIOFF_040584 [Zingiber officinale]
MRHPATISAAPPAVQADPPRHAAVIGESLPHVADGGSLHPHDVQCFHDSRGASVGRVICTPSPSPTLHVDGGLLRPHDVQCSHDSRGAFVGRVSRWVEVAKMLINADRSEFQVHGPLTDSLLVVSELGDRSYSYVHYANET